MFNVIVKYCFIYLQHTLRCSEPLSPGDVVNKHKLLPRWVSRFESQGKTWMWLCVQIYIIDSNEIVMLCLRLRSDFTSLVYKIYVIFTLFFLLQRKEISSSDFLHYICCNFYYILLFFEKKRECYVFFCINARHGFQTHEPFSLLTSILNKFSHHGMKRHSIFLSLCQL